MRFSIFPEISFFPNKISKILRIQRRSNLHPSSAGIGRRLKTQRFTDMIAHRIKRSIIPPARESVIRLTIPIGPETFSIASLRSSGVSGKNTFFHKSFNPLKVNCI